MDRLLSRLLDILSGRIMDRLLSRLNNSLLDRLLSRLNNSLLDRLLSRLNNSLLDRLSSRLKNGLLDRLSSRLMDRLLDRLVVGLLRGGPVSRRAVRWCASAVPPRCVCSAPRGPRLRRSPAAQDDGASSSSSAASPCPHTPPSPGRTLQRNGRFGGPELAVFSDIRIRPV